VTGGATAAGEVLLCERNDPGRGELERFIQNEFRRRHGADVRSFLPLLLGIRDARGDVVGAAGYRPAAHERLYLEQYLDEPVEAGIARSIGGSVVTRAGIAEIGNFACTDCRIALAMIGMLAGFLLDRQHDWAVFTATATVRGIMRHLGVALAELGRAGQERINGGADAWGAYFSTDPRVVVANVPAWCRAHGFARSA